MVKARYQLRITSVSEWSDNVFDPAYSLRSLRWVEWYVKQNGHLPGIPSADQVVKEGVELVKLNAVLLEKVEELTLYSIQQQKELEQVKQHHQQEIEELKQLLKAVLQKK